MCKGAINVDQQLRVGQLAVSPGEKMQGYLEVPGCSFGLPMTVINGKEAGKTVVITGGTHGGEYPGIETAIRLAGTLTPEEVSGQLIIVHPVNVPAFQAKLQYIGPYDGKNLNREYPGKATGTVTERIAYAISSQLFSQADFYMDLHGGDIHEHLTPFVFYSCAGTEENGAKAKSVAEVMGIRFVVRSVSSNGAFGCAAAMGVPAILAEIGGRGLWSEEEVQQYLAAVHNALRQLGVLSGAVQQLGEVVYSDGMVGLDAEQTGCWYPAVRLNDQIKKGDKVGVVKDYFGNLLGEYFAPQDGEVLYIISSLAINAGDPIIALG